MSITGMSHMRYRNDRSQTTEPVTIPAPTLMVISNRQFDGSLVHGSGFLVMMILTDDHFPDGEGTLRLNLYEDGILWLE